MYLVCLQPSVPDTVSTEDRVCETTAASQVLPVARCLQLPRAVSFIVSTFDCRWEQQVSLSAHPIVGGLNALSLKFSKAFQVKVTQKTIYLNFRVKTIGCGNLNDNLWCSLIYTAE